ncbi:acyl-CoA dehydrogenase family protein [Herbiconiux sp. CPCC 203407]|uniref:Acyl-CoA dehydrogenase family protein n=1 Tax=Herbiconiux oxytropis TaxID=2970915 RepID=A0AA42BTD6_9MICO|nr:acyl-CoA dehydrogenase family protein [Herbiconiux oxytropis]MCS5722170.1 acyl-CoA dehydrogenase family protein [Herbiconiux oxytropis]MCS5725752.1 acyl-CoA dehydrogenase family protein [Herbiconiux oxytropis]
MSTSSTGPATSFDRDATEHEVVEWARSLKELIRSQQDEAEERGHYSTQVHERMQELGLNHLLTPRRFGGLEVSLKTWLRVVIEISAADPGSGWCYCLGHSHNIQAAALWPESVQREAFAAPEGYFRSSHSLSPAGTARKVEGGYELTGVSRYQSGSPFSTHAIVFVTVEGETDAAGRPRTAQVLLPRSAYTPLDDWGQGRVLGMRASGSNSVAFERALVPAEHLVPATWAGEIDPAETGAALHGNPMYVGSVQAFLGAELAAVTVGAARAALDEWEELSRVRKAPLPPFALRDHDPASQRIFGEASIKADAAEAILMQVADTIAEWSEAFVLRGAPLTRGMDTRLNGLTLEAGRLAAEAVDLLFQSAGSSEARPGRRMERYARDIMMYRTHAAAQYGVWMQGIGATILGVQRSAFDMPDAVPAGGAAPAAGGAPADTAGTRA